MKQIKKQVQRGLLDPNKDDPFELFMSSTQVSQPRTSPLPQRLSVNGVGCAITRFRWPS
jgi:hypothetical protein